MAATEVIHFRSTAQLCRSPGIAPVLEPARSPPRSNRPFIPLDSSRFGSIELTSLSGCSAYIVGTQCGHSMLTLSTAVT